MSNDVTNFAASLVEMAKAMERVPELEGDLSKANNILHQTELMVIDLEVSLEASRRYAASLEQRCHDLEVSRDAAELRFLEADDVVATIKSVLRRTMEDADSALKAVEPLPEPTPEPVTEPVSVQESPIGTTDGQSALVADTTEQESSPVCVVSPSPFPDTTPSTVQSAEDGMGKSEVDPTGTPAHSHGQSVSVPEESVTTQEVGKSEVPFAATTTPPNPAHPSPATTLDVGSSQTEASDAKPIGPYFGRNYMSVPGFISRLDWLAGGGTNEGYDWRP